MDILANQYKRRDMSEKKPNKNPNKTQILTLSIAFAGLLIVILSILLLTGRSLQNSGAIAQATTNSSSQKSYAEGRDYVMKYSNAGIVDKATISELLRSH